VYKQLETNLHMGEHKLCADRLRLYVCVPPYMRRSPPLMDMYA